MDTARDGVENGREQLVTFRNGFQQTRHNELRKSHITGILDCGTLALGLHRFGTGSRRNEVKQ